MTCATEIRLKKKIIKKKNKKKKTLNMENVLKLFN